MNPCTISHLSRVVKTIRESGKKPKDRRGGRGKTGWRGEEGRKKGGEKSEEEGWNIYLHYRDKLRNK